ncbi:MAG: hypothetical protein ACKOF9_08120 [Burkholderiales bacterium]
MSSSLSNLLAISSSEVTPKKEININHLIDDDCTVSADLLSQLVNVYLERNGFFAFESSLWFYDYELMKTINNIDCLKLYEEQRRERIFFASDALATQFFIDKEKIGSLDLETGEESIISKSFESWATEVLSDPDFLLGYPLMRDWQQENGKIKNSCRLAPITPFILGGNYSVENLVELDITELIEFKSNLYSQISNLPPGSQVEWKLVR